jgi:hypothetical protein
MLEESMKFDQLKTEPGKHKREGWEAHFASMAEHADDQLLDGFIPTQWDDVEWTWLLEGSSWDVQVLEGD